MGKPFCADLLERNLPLHPFSTFGIGGAAQFFYVASEIEEMQAVLAYCYRERIRFFILGKGSNSLFDDRGFLGVVILNKIGGCLFDGPQVEVGGGYSFSLLGVQSAKKGYAGLEFGCGIPASVGGAIFMNAGANGEETATRLMEVSFVNERGELEILQRDQMSFGYRFSSFQQRKGAIVGARFLLEPCARARAKQLEIIRYRTRTQPYGEKSIGCVFKNTPAHSAGALIEGCGLKGYRIGGAEISSLHANFIINNAQASAADVLALAACVQKKVKQQTGCQLEMEIRYIEGRG